MSVRGGWIDQGEAAPAPAVLREAFSGGRVTIKRLAEGTAMQLVRYAGEQALQISDLIPRGERAAAIQHFQAAHRDICLTVNCADARWWLRPPLRSPRDAVGA